MDKTVHDQPVTQVMDSGEPTPWRSLSLLEKIETQGEALKVQTKVHCINLLDWSTCGHVDTIKRIATSCLCSPRVESLSANWSRLVSFVAHRLYKIAIENWTNQIYPHERSWPRDCIESFEAIACHTKWPKTLQGLDERVAVAVTNMCACPSRAK